MSAIGEMRFHSIQIYSNELADLSVYKAQEVKFNKIMPKASNLAVTDGQALFKEVFGTDTVPTFVSQKQDIVAQLVSGVGWRVAGWHEGQNTRSALVRSNDERGVKFIVTAPRDSEPSEKKQKTQQFDHFDKANIDTYFKAHMVNASDTKSKGGVAVLCFELETGAVAKVAESYKMKHPKLVKGEHAYDGFKIIESYAYYLPNSTEADKGTVLRFLERSDPKALMPGLEATEAEWAVPCEAYFDHWVSNVVDRKQFIQTMNDCLGFTPKVDFNAGVVAAGEAIIESTVIGNNPSFTATSKKEILEDQSQIYLPINNALSEVGHVHLYLEQLGQGIQHIASRVPDLLQFISRTNKFRDMTGHGFSFLKIPRSYYGRLANSAVGEVVGDANVDGVLQALEKSGLMDSAGVVTIDISDTQINEALAGMAGVAEKVDELVTVIKRSRFINLIKLLGDSFSDNTYLEIVKNKILIDIQENDVLYQIFTANVLQDEAGEEAPFLEFIQRVCSERKGKDGKPLPIRPGCGGFGIRNFLTLFLSIEVSKAMNAVVTATQAGDKTAAALAQEQVQTLTEQLDESNPILTLISDSMTAEADALASGDKEKAATHAQKKAEGQEMLQACSDKYKAKMRELRMRK